MKDYCLIKMCLDFLGEISLAMALLDPQNQDFLHYLSTHKHICTHVHQDLRSMINSIKTFQLILNSVVMEPHTSFRKSKMFATQPHIRDFFERIFN